MNEKQLSSVIGILVLVGTVFGFFWLWSQADSYIKVTAVPENLQQIEIETIKNDAQDILENKELSSNIPISVATDKMGRENPFDEVK